MGRIIGFIDFPKAWEGPVILQFGLVSEHTKTARYQCRLEKRVFDLYAPLFVLPDFSTPASQILVALGKTLGSIQTIGFRGEPKPLKIGSQICEFAFDKDMSNSKRYCHLLEGQRYYLYMPNEVFAEDLAPPRVFLRVAVPSSGGQ